MSLKEKAKTELPCVECEVFQKTKNLANRALICETARAIGHCLIIKKLENAEQKLQQILHEFKTTNETASCSIAVEELHDHFCPLKKIIEELLKEEKVAK